MVVKILLIKQFAKASTMTSQMIKKVFWDKVKQALKDTSADWIEGWVKGEKSFINRYIKPNKDDLKRYKDVIIDLLDSTTPETFLEKCRKARPDLNDLWKKEKTFKAIEKEIKNIKKYVDKL